MRALALTLGLVAGLWTGRAWADDPQAWRQWKPIAAAVAIDPLDGPEELLEKAEIIADRRDALQREQGRLTPECAAVDEGLRSIAQQIEVTEEIVTLRGGRTTVLRNRLHTLRGRKRDLYNRLRVCRANLSAIEAAAAALTTQYEDYVQRIEALRVEEATVIRPEESP